MIVHSGNTKLVNKYIYVSMLRKISDSEKSVQCNEMKSEFYYDRSNDFASPDIISRKFECNLSNPIDSNKVRKRGPL